MKNFYIITNRSKDPDLIMQEKIRSYLTEAGMHCEAASDTDPSVGTDRVQNIAPEDTDVILVLGGDGTMLKAADDNAAGHTPLLGINLGTMGYMADAMRENWKGALDSLIAGNYEIEERMMLEGSAGNSEETLLALNDVAITRSGRLQVVPYDVYVNGQFLNRYEADGIILSTPTGSTGYNLSAGGPIVEPGAKLILLTPICPHTLNTRSIIFSPEDTIEIEIGRSRDGKTVHVEADFDGSDHALLMHSGQKISVRASERTTGIIKVTKQSFLEILHRKFN